MPTCIQKGKWETKAETQEPLVAYGICHKDPQGVHIRDEHRKVEDQVLPGGLQDSTNPEEGVALLWLQTGTWQQLQLPRKDPLS